MAEEDKDTKSLRQGYQAKSDEFGYQPNHITLVKKGYQPKIAEGKPEGKNPPSGGSNVKPPKKGS